jgi:hypothetical protein
MNNEGGLDDRGLEPRRDERPTGGQADAKAEMRETDPGQLGATRETPREQIGQDVREVQDVADRINDRRNLERGRIKKEAERYEEAAIGVGREEVGRVAQEIGGRISTAGEPYAEAAMRDLREAGRDEIDRVAQEGADRIRTAEERYEKAGIEDLRNAARDEIGRVAKDGTDPNRSEVERVERVEKNDLRDVARDEIDRGEQDVARTIAEGERDIKRADRAANNERRETQTGM